MIGVKLVNLPNPCTGTLTKSLIRRMSCNNFAFVCHYGIGYNFAFERQYGSG